MAGIGLFDKTSAPDEGTAERMHSEELRGSPRLLDAYSNQCDKPRSVVIALAVIPPVA